MLHDRKYIKEKINRSTYTKCKAVPVALQRRSLHLANQVFPPYTEILGKLVYFLKVHRGLGFFFLTAAQYK